jgi:hypothetical protein
MFRFLKKVFPLFLVGIFLLTACGVANPPPTVVSANTSTSPASVKADGSISIMKRQLEVKPGEIVKDVAYLQPDSWALNITMSNATVKLNGKITSTNPIVWDIVDSSEDVTPRYIGFTVNFNATPGVYEIEQIVLYEGTGRTMAPINIKVTILKP